MIKTGKPIAMDVVGTDNARNLMITAHGSMRIFSADNARIEITIAEENGKQTLWLRVMRRDNPFEYYKE